MKIFYDRSVHENASYYYDLAKKAREKISGLEKAIEETEKEIKEAGKPVKKDVKIKRKKEWYEKFHSAFTSGGLLMIGGRSAQQNDQLFAKHMEDEDLFFHADIQGGSAVILKGGLAAGNREQETGNPELAEAAQFAACHSNAWKNGNASVDVYCAEKSQVSKHATGGYIPTGAFAITGQRKWFRATQLSLRVGKTEGGTVAIVPGLSKTHLDDELIIIPSKTGKEKGQLAKSLAKRFSVHPDELLSILPSGKSKTKEAQS
ncbi:MAG: NFACT RNA binding domain-containing protein [Candidatus Micrarchaeota archaeon]